MSSWVSVFPDCVTEKGNLKRSISKEKLNEIYQYRVTEVSEGKIRATGVYVKSTVPCKVECTVCGYTWMPLPKNILAGVGCPSCSGKVKVCNVEKSQSSNIDIPPQLRDRWPNHAALRGVHDRYMGVQWIDPDSLYDDIVYIVNSEGRYFIFTMSSKIFKDKVDAQLFLQGGLVSQSACPDYYHTHIAFRSHYKCLEWEINDELGPGIAFGWVTKYAPLIKYCLEKWLRETGCIGYIDDTDFTEYWNFSKEVLHKIKGLNSIELIESVLDWPLKGKPT